MPTLVLGNYNATKSAEGLLIKNVELSRETTKAERPDFLRDLNVDTFKQFLVHYNRRVEQGKVGAFILLGHQGDGVGRILNARIEGKQLVGDLLVTNPEVIGMVERGELTERSIEWGWNKTDANLVGVALLSGQIGQDSEGWPDLTVDVAKNEVRKDFEISEDYEFKSVDYSDTLSQSSKQNKSEKEEIMPLTEEDMATIAKMIADAVGAKMEDEKPDEEEKADDEEDLESEVEKAAERKITALKAETEKRERKTKITTYVQTLRNNGSYYSDGQLKHMFEKKKTDEGMEELFKRLSVTSEADAKLDIESDNFPKSKDEEYKAEYKAYKASHPDTTVTEQDFLDMAYGTNKADLSGKKRQAV